jgi:hypothetical protein
MQHQSHMQTYFFGNRDAQGFCRSTYAPPHASPGHGGFADAGIHLMAPGCAISCVEWDATNLAGAGEHPVKYPRR